MKVYELEEAQDGTMHVEKKPEIKGAKANGKKVAAGIAAAAGVAFEVILGLPVYIVLAVVAVPAALITLFSKLGKGRRA